MVKLISGFAPAKLNLYLRVTGRRENGYHELDSIFVPISICDRIAIEARPSHRAAVSLCGSFGNLPADERNLAVRAAAEFMREFAVTAEVRIDLRKSIPAGAGLGGGSSDAASVLRMLATIFRVGIDQSERLAATALKMGADVPFFLDPVPARVTGIGEHIAPLGEFAPMALVVAVPPIEVPTAAVFRDLAPGDWSGPASDADVRAMVAGESSPRLLVNDLARPAMARWPEIARVKAHLEEFGANAASMTGSGAGVFGVFSSPAAAGRAAVALRDRDPCLMVLATTIYTPDVNN